MVFTSFLLVILNSNYWIWFVLIFYVYNSKIHFICAIPFIFRSLFLVVASSYPFMGSLIFSQKNGVVSSSPLLIAIFWFFFFPLIAHDCDLSFGSLLTSELLYWAIILLLYTPPPQKPASGLVLWSGDDDVDDDRSFSDTALLSPLLAIGSPPVKKCPG